MRTIELILLMIPLAACDGARLPEGVSDSIQSEAVMGFIPPDTAYRGMFVARAGYICGLVLIEAGEFAEDASITFNTSPPEPAFPAASCPCSVTGSITVMRLGEQAA